MINNAGFGAYRRFVELEPSLADELLSVHVRAVMQVTRAALPGMLARGRGHIVAMSSLAAYRGLPKMAGYCATKAGVNGLLEGLRIELRSRGIDVSTICPGWIRTPLTADIKVPQPFMMDVDYAARRIVEAIRKKKRFFGRYVAYIVNSRPDRDGCAGEGYRRPGEQRFFS